VASKVISRLAVPLAIGLGLPTGLTVGREFGGDDRILRILYGGAASVVVALVVVGVFVLLARRSGKDAEPGAAPDPARDSGSGSA
jgi:hypothetical protein